MTDLRSTLTAMDCEIRAAFLLTRAIEMATDNTAVVTPDDNEAIQEVACAVAEHLEKLRQLHERLFELVIRPADPANAESAA